MDGGFRPVLQRGALIGPNAILQLVDVLEARGQASLCAVILARAGVVRPPKDSGMLPETDCAAVHQAVRVQCPENAEVLLRDAGHATGAYILTHRIPRMAQAVLRTLPGSLAAPVLASAITRHAWTFAGTGQFKVARRAPLVFSIAGNPLVRGWSGDHPQCAWHTAVFEKLFRTLVWPNVRVVETACCACGDPACRFELSRC